MVIDRIGLFWHNEKKHRGLRKMNLYLIKQTINNDYDTYDSAVVAASSEDEARTIHPSRFVTHNSNGKFMGTYTGGPRRGEEYDNDHCGWVKFSEIDKITVELIGVTDMDKGVILSSFNAG